MRLSAEVRFELPLDDVGGEQQRALAKLPTAAAPDRRVASARRIDDDDFVGAVDELLRNGLGAVCARGAAR